MNGHALGGGAELALACDLRILHARATFGFPETRLGIFPGAGGSQRLPRLVGPHRAKRLIFDGSRLSADDALALGLVDLVAGDDFDTVVMHEAQRLADLPTATIGFVKPRWSTAWTCRSTGAIDEVEEAHVMANLELRGRRRGPSGVPRQERASVHRSLSVARSEGRHGQFRRVERESRSVVAISASASLGTSARKIGAVIASAPRRMPPELWIGTATEQ